MTDKATWWSITSFQEEEICTLEDVSTYPDWVAKVYGGREKCPDTGRVHFQGALQCRTQHRFSKVKAWLPKAHIEAAKSALALKKYAMKAETAVGEKTEKVNPKKFLDAQAICRLITSKTSKADRQTDRQNTFWRAVQALIIEDPGLTGQLMNPSLKNFWVKTSDAWYRLQDMECDSITHIPPDDDQWEETGEYIDDLGVKWIREENIWIRYNDGTPKTDASEASRQEGQQADEGGDH